MDTSSTPTSRPLNSPQSSLSALAPPSTFSQVRTSLKEEKLSIRNRLLSIKHDAGYVSAVADHFSDLPLIANERCGGWYVRPERKAGSAYFKSTDGHWGGWRFNTRRLNIPVLELIGRGGGCILVDSTRRGKVIPDALSKTVPVWCCVLNRSLFPEEKSYHQLVTPGVAVGESEHAQIEARLEGFVADFKSLNQDANRLKLSLGKPLYPLFLTPDADLPKIPPAAERGYHPLICLTASQQEDDADLPQTDYVYVQGAADDTETWAHGLTSKIFWKCENELSDEAGELGESELRERIAASIIAERNNDDGKSDLTKVKLENGRSFFVGTLSDAARPPKDVAIVVYCSDKEISDASSVNSSDGSAHPKLVHLRCQSGKLGSRKLREELVKEEGNILKHLQSQGPCEVLLACPTGRDLSIGLALWLSCLLSQQGTWQQNTVSTGETKLDKLMIRRQLVTIQEQIPGANPSRTTLQSINAVLMERPG